MSTTTAPGTEAAGRSAGAPAVPYRGALTVLVVLVSIPLASWVAPASEPSGWALLPPVLVALAAAGGARSAGRRPLLARGGRAGHPLRLAILVLTTLAADLTWRTALRAAVPDVRAMPDVDGTSLLAAAMVAAGWYVAADLAGRVEQVARTRIATHVLRSVGAPLAAGGATLLLAAGLVQRDASTPGWHVAGGAAAACVYAVVALVLLQRLQRTALEGGWTGAQRRVDSAVARHWAVWVFLLIAGTLLVTVPWWTPPAEPLRQAAEQPYLLDWLLSYWREPPRPPGEFLERVEEPDGAGGGAAGFPAALVAGAVAAVLLLAAVAAVRSRRGGAQGAAAVQARLRGLREWWATLRLVLAGMLRRRASARSGGRGRSAGREPGGRATGGPGLGLRPSTPRAQVRHDYRRVLRQARPQCPRMPWQSPTDYAAALRRALPDHANAVDALTRHFVEARYSHHRIEPEDAEDTREAGRTLRAALRERARRGASGRG